MEYYAAFKNSVFEKNLMTWENACNKVKRKKVDTKQINSNFTENGLYRHTDVKDEE